MHKCQLWDTLDYDTVIGEVLGLTREMCVVKLMKYQKY